MPSLHAAFPTVIALVGFRHFGWRAWPTAIYAALLYIAFLYLRALPCRRHCGHARFFLLLSYGVLAPLPVEDPKSSSIPFLRPEHRPGFAFLVTVILLLADETSGLWAQSHFKMPYVPNEDFSEGELKIRSRSFQARVEKRAIPGNPPQAPVPT